MRCGPPVASRVKHAVGDSKKARKDGALPTGGVENDRAHITLPRAAARCPYSHATVTEPLPTAGANPDGSSMRPSRV